MEQQLKERLVGAAVIILIAVIFIPMFLSEQPVTNQVQPDVTDNSDNSTSNQQEYHSSIKPIEISETEITPVIVPEPDMVKTEEVKEAVQPVLSKDETKPVEAVSDSKATPIDKSKTTSNIPGNTQGFVVQLGSFSSQENAEKLNQRLLDAGFKAFVEPLQSSQKTVYRVRVGPSLKKAKVEKYRTEIKSKLGVDGIIVQYP